MLRSRSEAKENASGDLFPTCRFQDCSIMMNHYPYKEYFLYFLFLLKSLKNKNL